MKTCFFRLVCLALTAMAAVESGCRRQTPSGTDAEIAVANTYLLAAVEDLCGDQPPVLNLVPPGMCPGHFDISPGQVGRLARCRMLFVFGFQQNTETIAARVSQTGLAVCRLNPDGGLCLPRTYAEVVRAAAGAVGEQFPDRKDRLEARCRQIEARLSGLEAELSQAIDQGGLKQAPVLVSAHQAAFARWLGLEVVATFAGSDTETAAQINATLRQIGDRPVRYVVANRQEGTALAEALARRLKAEVVVFSNFPEAAPPGEAAFDAMLRRNLQPFIRTGP